MNAIRETISEMEKRIKRLGERSQEISQIVNLINTISERTHVLSLNAAMQAAMAGEAGRGFAVVAEEVQRLAENSRQATGQIANLVQNIQVETNDTIATVNKTIEQVVKESDLAHNAGERMRETHEATARLVRLVATIATSSAEQTKIAAVVARGRRRNRAIHREDRRATRRAKSECGQPGVRFAETGGCDIGVQAAADGRASDTDDPLNRLSGT